MKHVNYFKPNVVPMHEMAERQWKWNFLRKTRRKFGYPRKDFKGAARGIGLFSGCWKEA